MKTEKEILKRIAELDQLALSNKDKFLKPVIEAIKEEYLWVLGEDQFKEIPEETYLANQDSQ